MNLSKKETELLNRAKTFLRKHKKTFDSLEKQEEIDHLRNQINNYDDCIIYAIKQRMQLVDDIQQIKQDVYASVVDEDRESDILERVNNNSDEYVALMNEIYSVIFNFVRYKYE